ncbi:MAG TPA: peptidylprolyl isomerase [Vicinamibacterales bacterium]|nr:peptidylprolyl isomerase [Vicinamibacterales bacterium]
MIALLIVLALLGSPRSAAAQARGQAPPPRPAQAARPQPARPQPPADTYFVNTLAPADMQNKQAVLETSMGTIVLDLLPDAAPNHVAHFITRAREGAYDGTIFHRVILNGIIQGGDPLSKDPAQSARYGTGGMRELRFERNGEPMTRGAVAAVLAPNMPDSGGSQFFICIFDQPAITGQYTVFGRVAEGLNVAQKISQAPAENTVPNERVVIRTVTIRDKAAPGPEPFSTETADELSRYRAVLETSLGNITFQFFPEKAPNHVRNFLRLASVGFYDGTAFHRVVKGFVIQGGFLPTRGEPLDITQDRYVRKMAPEFNDTAHDKGTVSLAHGDDPASGDTSFFIVLARTPVLDGKYSAFGRVVDGMDVVEKIEQVPVTGETPANRIELRKVTVSRVP